MKFVRGLYNLNDSHHGTVLTIGNFDGVHLGHQQIIKRLKQCAEYHGLPSTVMIFEPHPEELFSADNAPARLTSLREKLKLFNQLGVDQVVLVKFNHRFSKMEPHQFVGNILIEKLGIKHLIIGDDFKFGVNRSGDYQLLLKLSNQYSFQLENTDTLSLDGHRISSTYVRETIAQGNFELSEQLLGRSYRKLGHVFHGDKRGRTIGFPTANIRLENKNSPVSGVYAVRLCLLNRTQKTEFMGVANVGSRPTVNGTRKQLEVHCFNLKESIYGELVEVEFCDFIRAEQKFGSIEELIAQIKLDAQTARQYFTRKDKLD